MRIQVADHYTAIKRDRYTYTFIKSGKQGVEKNKSEARIPSV